MAALGLESYRFSISWPRVQPDGAGPLNPAGVRFYRDLVEGLLERGIEPAATLYHWDLPQALQDAGGWANRDTAERFAEYAQHMARELGDLVRTWITHNEPWVATFPGHAQGRFAPGVRDWPTALAVSHHLLLSHGLAAAGAPGQRRDHPQPLARVPGGARRGGGGAALRRPPQPLVPGPGAARRLPAGRARALRAPRRADRRRSATATSRSSRGRSTSSASTTTSPRACARTRASSRWAWSSYEGPPPLTAMGWEVEPDGLYELLVRLQRDYGVPIAITENGAAFDDPPAGNGLVEDPDRVAYLDGHLDAVRPRDRRRRGRPRLLRVVADGQLRVEPRLRQALRDRARRLRRPSGARSSAAARGTATSSRARATPRAPAETLRNPELT